MGGKNSKKANNEDLKKIGEEANKNNPSQFYISTTINLTNDLLIGKSKSNPSDDYTVIKILGEGSYARVYKVKTDIQVPNTP